MCQKSHQKAKKSRHYSFSQQKSVKYWKDFTQYKIFKASALWDDAFYKSKYPSVCVSVCLCVHLFTFEVPFKRLFAPTSQSRMSKIFRDSETLGEKYWKEVVSDFKKISLKMV